MKQPIFTLMALLFTAAVSFAQTARVQIIHNAPDPSVDVYVNGLLALDDFTFRSATPFLDLPAGVPLSIAVAPSTSTSVLDAIATFTETFESGQTYVVTASGIVASPTTPFTLITDAAAQEVATNGASNVNLSVLHGSPDAPVVDIAVRTVGTIITDLSYGAFTPYISVPTGIYYLDVKAAGTQNIVGTYRADLSGAGGQAIKVIASGLLGGTPGFGLYAVFADGTVVELPLAPVARLQVIHNSPSPTVDVYANGDLLLNDFAYRKATPFIFVPAGTPINIGVALSTSVSVNDTLVNFPVTFENGKTYIVTASGIVGNPGTPFNLNVNDSGREIGINPGKVDIAVLHGATNAPAVDVDATFVANNVVSNLANGQFTPYLSLNPDKYDLAVRAAGNAGIVASFRADLSGLAGKSAYVFASGLLSGSPAFGLFAALPNGNVIELPTTPTTRVQIVHNSPSPTVDVYAGNTLLINDFTFRTATPFVDFPADRDVSIGVAPGNSNSVNDVIAGFPVNFASNKSYTVFANGVVGSPTSPFQLVAADDARETANPGETAVSVFHGAVDAPAVDVAERLAGTLVSNLSFGQFSNYLDLASADYFLDIKPAGSSQIVGTYNADLSALGGQAIRVFASGYLNGTPGFGLFAVFPDGAVVELPFAPVARLQIIHNSPTPTVDVYANGGLFLDNFEFRTAIPYIYVPAGLEINIGIAPANSQSVSDTLVNFPLTLENGKTYVAVASGIVGNASTPFKLIINDLGRERSTDANKFDVAVLHGAPDAPSVDLNSYDDGSTLLGGLQYGDFINYVSFDPALHYFELVPTSAPTQTVGIWGGDFSALAGQAFVVFASGLLSDGSFDLWVTLSDGTTFALPSQARVQVIHNAPSPTVDVYYADDFFTDGILALDNFAFRQATSMGLFPARTPFTLVVAPENSASINDGIYTLPVAGLETGKTYIIMANGVVGGNPGFELTVNANGRARAQNPANAEFAAFHGSPDAPEVDVTLYNGPVIVDNLSFGEFSDYLSVPATDYVISVTPSNNNNTVVQSYSAPLTGLQGQAFTVFASGFLTGQPGFGLWVALTDGTTFPLPVFVSTNELDRKLQSVQISPNPAINEVWVKLNLTESETLRYAIRDVAGRLMTEGDFGQVNAGEFTRKVELGQLPAGMYQMEIRSDAGIRIQKFVVQQ